MASRGVSFQLSIGCCIDPLSPQPIADIGPLLRLLKSDGAEFAESLGRVTRHFRRAGRPNFRKLNQCLAKAAKLWFKAHWMRDLT
jgi:hypothetical protein